MCSPGVSARDRVLAELAGVGPGTADPLALLDQVRDLAGFIDRAQGELARLTGALDAAGGAAEAGLFLHRGVPAARLRPRRRAGPGNWSRPDGLCGGCRPPGRR